MKKTIFLTMMLMLQIIGAFAQNDTIFNRTIYNKEFNIYLKINLYEKNITIPNQEFMGEMAGYIGDYKDFRKWFILDGEITEPNKANLELSNDECSEDLIATLSYNQDGTYTLTQGPGSTIKIARNRKWKKLPKEIIFTINKE